MHIEKKFNEIEVVLSKGILKKNSGKLTMKARRSLAIGKGLTLLAAISIMSAMSFIV
jgi:hypothetical protein